MFFLKNNKCVCVLYLNLTKKKFFNFFKMCVCSFFQYNQKCFFKNNKCVCVLYLNLTKKLKEKNLGQSGFEPGCAPKYKVQHTTGLCVCCCNTTAKRSF